MPALQTLILVAGLLHFGILIASALTPGVLAWGTELRKLSPLSRNLVWVHGWFIVLIIAGFGAVSLLHAADLAHGPRLARSVCAFIALFWAARLGVQFFVFDASPYLNRLH